MHLQSGRNCRRPFRWAEVFARAVLGLAAGPCASRLGAAERAPTDLLRLKSDKLQIGIDRTTGQLVELTDRATQRNLVEGVFGGGGLWELELGRADVGRLTPAHAHACEPTSAEDPARLRLVWRGFGLPQAPDLRVEVTVSLDANESLSRWRLAVEQPGQLALRAIHFPRLLGVPPQPGERLAVPAWLGQQVANPRALLAPPGGPAHRWEWPYPGLLSLQCLALTSEAGPGLYAACDDAAGYLKRFAVFGDGAGGLHLEIVHPPEGEGGSRDRYTLPYAAVLGSFPGDWFGAAALYRSWATNQSWAQGSRLKRGLVPAWVTNTALWVWNRGRSSGVIDPALALQDELGLRVSVFWHWWHGCAYDTGFPEYLPPREGAASFQAALERAHQQGVHALVYMNQRLWGMTTASWTNEQAARFAVKAVDGRVRPEVYNTFTRQPCATMCLGTEFWRNKYAGLAEAAFRDLGVDGIYMDQACTSLACYDPQHGHPLGGGTYWMNGCQTLAADIRRRCAGRGGITLAGEGCAENWLPHLDLMLSLQVSRERYAGPDGWEVIPFFHAVYHPFGVFYGNYSSLTQPPYDELWPAAFAPKEPLQLLDRKFARQFCLEQARAFVWGQQPTLANFLPAQLRQRPDEMAFLFRLARVRARATKYLLHGELLPPPKLVAPEAELEMSRLSIYAGQRDGLKEFRKTVPLALAAAWRAPDGAVAVALASIADGALTPALFLDARAWGLPERGRIWRLDEAERKPLGEFSGANPRLKPELGPRDACLLELTRD